MKKYCAVFSAALLALFIACGSGDDKAETAQKFMDSIAKEGDLLGAYNLLSAGDRAMLGMFPGVSELLAGKFNEDMPEEIKLLQYFLSDITPIPENLLNYKIGKPYGSGDTAYVPITVSIIKDDPENIIKDNIDPEIRDRLDKLGNGFEELSYDDKTMLIAAMIASFKRHIKDKTFAMESQTQEITLIKEGGKWRISLMGALMSQAFSMQPEY